MPLDAILLISVGELLYRKNHKVMVDALQELPMDYWYMIVGMGEFEEEILARDLTNHLKL